MSEDTIKIGVLSPASGPIAAGFSPFVGGATARFEAQNANGGVGGRSIEIVQGDDKGDPTESLAAARQLVEGDEVFGVVEGSVATDGSSDYLLEQGIPVTGWPFNASWRDAKYENMFGPIGSATPSQVDKNEAYARWFKDSGATSVALVGLQDPTSVNSLEQLASALTAEGVAVGLVDNSAPFGATDFTAQAQKAKENSVDAVFASVTPDMTVGIAESFRQAGLDYTTMVSLVGYDPRVLESAGAAAEGLAIPMQFQPFETGSDEVNQVATAIETHANGTPMNDAALLGWLSGDLMIRGIEAAGTDCPTREGFIEGLRGVSDYDGGGLVSGPVNFDASTYFGFAQDCSYFVEVVNGEFTLANDGEPVCPE